MVIRIVQIALLLAIIPFGPARSEDVHIALGQAKGEWEWCVETTHPLLPWPTPRDMWTRPEAAFDKCRAEEELLLASIDLAFSESGRRQARLQHYKQKLDIKTRLANSDFQEITKQIGKK